MPKNTKATTRTLIGYWHDSRAEQYSHPQPLVDPAWETARRHLIVEYLKSGRAYGYGCGYSYCRFGCTAIAWMKTDDPSKGEYREMTTSYSVGTPGHMETVVEHDFGYYEKLVRALPNGTRYYCDDVWCWPEGLAHYVETHGIRLPDEFVAHVAARAFRAPDALTNPRHIAEDDRFWREWCRTNAPFEYESNCIACNPGRWP